MQTIALRDLEPGARFRLPHTGRTGTLLMVNDCRARVRYDGSGETRTIGETTFDAPGKPVDITPNCAVAVQEEVE